MKERSPNFKVSLNGKIFSMLNIYNCKAIWQTISIIKGNVITHDSVFHVLSSHGIR